MFAKANEQCNKNPLPIFLKCFVFVVINAPICESSQLVNQDNQSFENMMFDIKTIFVILQIIEIIEKYKK